MAVWRPGPDEALLPPDQAEVRRLHLSSEACYARSLGYLPDDGRWRADPAAERVTSRPCPPAGCPGFWCPVRILNQLDVAQ